MRRILGVLREDVGGVKERLPATVARGCWRSWSTRIPTSRSRCDSTPAPAPALAPSGCRPGWRPTPSVPVQEALTNIRRHAGSARRLRGGRGQARRRDARGGGDRRRPRCGHTRPTGAGQVGHGLVGNAASGSSPPAGRLSGRPATRPRVARPRGSFPLPASEPDDRAEPIEGAVAAATTAIAAVTAAP